MNKKETIVSEVLDNVSKTKEQKDKIISELKNDVEIIKEYLENEFDDIEINYSNNDKRYKLNINTSYKKEYWLQIEDALHNETMKIVLRHEGTGDKIEKIIYNKRISEYIPGYLCDIILKKYYGLNSRYNNLENFANSMKMKNEELK